MRIINLLWTGGWDSTFRLLYLLLVERKLVQPYYIIDTKRESTPVEIKTMRRIREKIFEKFPRAKELLAEIIFKNRNDIKENKKFAKMQKELSKKNRIGTQYVWLASFSEQEKIDELELCVDGYAPGVVNSVLKPEVVGEGHECRLADKVKNKNVELFRLFRFPLVVDYWKGKAGDFSRRQGVDDIMELTWFCHHPKDGKPCRKCYPCEQVKKAGLEYRFEMRAPD